MNDTDKIRAAFNQSHFMTPMANLVVTEGAIIAIVVAVLSLVVFQTFLAFTLGLVLTPFVLAFLFFSKYDLIGYIIMGLVWAAPFGLLGICVSGAFWVFAVVAFFVSVIVHYVGIRYFRDLTFD